LKAGLAAAAPSLAVPATVIIRMIANAAFVAVRVEVIDAA
jgi:hypothetical protein